MCFQSCYNHALLVNNVYPKAGEEGAKTNNLSYLMFYAKSRPQKLIKVGNYLEKKAKRDIWNSRQDLVKVTLTILDSLFNSCPQHTNLISKNAVNIFYDILSSNMDLLTEVTNTFMNFSSKHDHTTLDIDESFHIKYLQVLEQFCKCCIFEGPNEQKRNETRLNGLKAIHSVVSSNTFLISPKIDNYLIVLQPLVENILISKSKSNLNISNAEEAKAHTLDKKGINGEVLELENVALKSISELMQKVTPATFEKVISPIYSYINEQDQWSFLHYLTKIIKIAMDSIQNQYRYLIITSLFKRLNDTDSTKNDIKIQTNIIFVLTVVITSNERSIGLTCLELLDNLTKHLLLSVKNNTNSKEDIKVFQSAVIDCIGSLARNIYYPEQTNDMLSFLINRLCFDGKAHDENKLVPTEKKVISTISNTDISDLNEYLDAKEIIEYRILIFQCLRKILENRKVSDSATSLNHTPVGIPLELISPTLGFLLTNSLEQKVEYFNFLDCILPCISTHGSTYSLKSQFKINKEFHLILYDYINKESLHLIDYILIHNTLALILKNFFVEETSMILLLIDKLQKLKQENTSIEEQIVYQTVLLDNIENISLNIKNESFKQFIDNVKEERKNNNQYIELNYDMKDIDNYKNKTFKDLGIKEDASPITNFITHQDINEHTNMDEELYNQYPELKENLENLSYAEIVKILSDDQHPNKTNSIFFENKHSRLANLSLPQLEPKISDFIDVTDLKNTLDLNNINNDYKLEDFTMEGYSNNNLLSNEITDLLNEITKTNTNTIIIDNTESTEKLEEYMESPTKSISTGSTMVNTSPVRSNLSPVSPVSPVSGGGNKDLFIIDEKNGNTIQQQSLAYPKMEMNMSSLMIPGSTTDLKVPKNTSIYVKEPSLR